MDRSLDEIINERPVSIIFWLWSQILTLHSNAAGPDPDLRTHLEVEEEENTGADRLETTIVHPEMV